jgi:hypothetical protein
MNELLKQAKEILAANKTDKAASSFMTNEQREVLAEDFASRKQFLSASHFTPDAEKRKEFERLFWENIRSKNN